MTTPKMDATKVEAAAKSYIAEGPCQPYGVVLFEALQTAFDPQSGNWSVRCRFMCITSSPSMRTRLVIVQDSSGKVVGGNEELSR